MRLMRSTVELARLHEDRAHALVIALGRLADALGESEEAFALSQEAVPLIGQLRPRKRKKHARELAEAFERHGERLRTGGDSENAVAARREAIAIREQWLATDQLALARSYSRLVRGLVADRQWDAALDAADAAVTILRTHGGGPELAAALLRRAAVLTVLERAEAAQADAAEAEAIIGPQ